ncbi:MAG: fructose bisphosphate aldolase [Pseudomonadota bacterium]
MMAVTTSDEQFSKVGNERGFIAALDQSGGSTPKALGLYGIGVEAWSNDDEMFDLVHEMRTRIIKSPSFTGSKVLGAILFENTMDRDIDGQPTAEFLWQQKQIVPFLKVDKGLADEQNGAQVMKPMPELHALLSRARAAGVFGTKMRSVIKEANEQGIASVVDQQFEVGRQIVEAGLVPIIEPEVDINCPDKGSAEILLREQLLKRLNELDGDATVMLKLTLPEECGFYSACVENPRVLRVVALSGGYSRDEANRRLSENTGVVASFSRALTEGLSAQQSEDDFNADLGRAVDSIYDASIT